MFNIFAWLAEFERELIRERTQAGLQTAPGPGPDRRMAQGIVGAGQTDHHGSRKPVSGKETVGATD